MPVGIYKHKKQQGFQGGHKQLNTGRTHFKKGVPSVFKGKKRPNVSGENHWNWKKDRTKLVKRQERNDSSYKEWRLNVWKRDLFRCKMFNENCKGRIEAHHILGWVEYPEFRYRTENGITLCQAHHPKKRAEEKRLILYFMGLANS